MARIWDGRRWGKVGGYVVGRHMRTSDLLISVFGEDDEGGDGERGTQRWFTREGKKKEVCQRKGLPINNRSEARPRR